MGTTIKLPVFCFVLFSPSKASPPTASLRLCKTRTSSPRVKPRSSLCPRLAKDTYLRFLPHATFDVFRDQGQLVFCHFQNFLDMAQTDGALNFRYVCFLFSYRKTVAIDGFHVLPVGRVLGNTLDFSQNFFANTNQRIPTIGVHGQPNDPSRAFARKATDGNRSDRSHSRWSNK